MGQTQLTREVFKMANFSDTHELYGWNGAAQFYQKWAEHKAQLEAELTFPDTQADWDEVDTGSPAFILNKPTTITQAQADAITANTAKRTYPEADETKLAGIESGATADVIDNATYGPAWGSDTTGAATRKAIFDKIETLGGGGDFMADGSVPMTGNFQGGGHLITGIADGVAATDAATVGQLAAGGGGDFMANGSVPMTGDFQGGGNLVTDIADGVAATDAATVGQLAGKLDTGATAADSAQLGGVPAADYFQESEFLAVSEGVGSAGKPIVLDSTGQIDPSMLDVSVFYYVSEFTPTAETEYPDPSGETYGAFWVVQGLTGDYTFAGGDLAGRTISNGDFMVWSSAGWSIMAGEMNPTLYYRLDGTQPLTDPFAGGGQIINNIADGVAANDAATVGQLAGLDFSIPIRPDDPTTPVTGDAWVNETDGLLKFKSATGTIVFEATQFIAD